VCNCSVLFHPDGLAGYAGALYYGMLAVVVVVARRMQQVTATDAWFAASSEARNRQVV
jgi:hypothetical protein